MLYANPFHKKKKRYDGHRDSILKGDDNKNQRDSSAGTSAEDLMRYFSISEFKGYQDTPKGFYNVFRSLFQKLADEEEEAYRNDPPEDEDDERANRVYPSFGNANTPYADADGYLGYGAYVRDFYGTWANFTTCKSFIWMDKWRLSDAPTRIIRRGMEKENKKAREAGRKEYQDTVRVSWMQLMKYAQNTVSLNDFFSSFTFRALQNLFVNVILE